MDMRVDSPTMAFMGVRISWLIRERNSLFAIFSASALATAFFMFAALTLALAITTMAAIIKVERALMISTASIGLLLINFSIV